MGVELADGELYKKLRKKWLGMVKNRFCYQKNRRRVLRYNRGIDRDRAVNHVIVGRSARAKGQKA